MSQQSCELIQAGEVNDFKKVQIILHKNNAYKCFEKDNGKKLSTNGCSLE